MGASSPMNMVAVGTPRGRSLATRDAANPIPNFAPLGAVNLDTGFATHDANKYLRLYVISPVFTVVPRR